MKSKAPILAMSRTCQARMVKTTLRLTPQVCHWSEASEDGFTPHSYFLRRNSCSNFLPTVGSKNLQECLHRIFPAQKLPALLFFYRPSVVTSPTSTDIFATGQPRRNDIILQCTITPTMPDTFCTDRAIITPIMPDNCDTGCGALTPHQAGVLVTRR